MEDVNIKFSMKKKELMLLEKINDLDLDEINEEIPLVITLEELFKNTETNRDDLSKKQKDALNTFLKHEDQNPPTNLKTANTLTKKEDRIAGRMTTLLFRRIKDLNKNEVVVNFVRKFLRDREFRITFILRSIKQRIIDYYERFEPYKEDQDLQSLDDQDPDYESNLSSFIRRISKKYPKSVTGNPLNHEKILLRYYCEFIFDITVNMLVRNCLLFTIDKKIDLSSTQIERVSFSQFPHQIINLSFDKPILNKCLKCARIGYLIDCWEGCKILKQNLKKVEKAKERFSLVDTLNNLENQMSDSINRKK